MQSQQSVPGLEEGHVHCGDVEAFYRWRDETVWCQDDCPRPRSWKESVRRVVTRHDNQTEGMSQRCGLACIPLAGGHWEPTYLSVPLCSRARPSP